MDKGFHHGADCRHLGCPGSRSITCTLGQELGTDFLDKKSVVVLVTPYGDETVKGERKFFMLTFWGQLSRWARSLTRAASQQPSVTGRQIVKRTEASLILSQVTSLDLTQSLLPDRAAVFGWLIVVEQSSLNLISVVLIVLLWKQGFHSPESYNAMDAHACPIMPLQGAH